MAGNNPNEPTPQELVRQAIAWANGKTPAEQSQLLSFLSSRDYLNRIDSREDYIKYPPRMLRFARIFKALLNNDSLAAQQTLVALTQVPTFKDSDAREEMLVKALAIVRPAPSVVVQYWDAHSTPDSIHLHFTIDALCRNGSDPAIALLEKKLIDPDQEVEYKLAWMRGPILEHRNDLPLLRGCHRLLQSTMDPDLKGALVEALCAYRKVDWYKSCDVPVPPPRSQASQEALAELRAICEYAKENLTLQPLEKVAVDTTLIGLP